MGEQELRELYITEELLIEEVCMLQLERPVEVHLLKLDTAISLVVRMIDSTTQTHAVEESIEEEEETLAVVCDVAESVLSHPRLHDGEDIFELFFIEEARTGSYFLEGTTTLCHKTEFRTNFPIDTQVKFLSEGFDELTVGITVVLVEIDLVEEVGRKEAIVVLISGKMFFPISFESFLQFGKPNRCVRLLIAVFEVLLYGLTKEETIGSCLVETGLVRCILDAIGEGEHFALCDIAFVEVRSHDLADCDRRECAGTTTNDSEGVAVALGTVLNESLRTCFLGYTTFGAIDDTHCFIVGTIDNGEVTRTDIFLHVG